MIANSMRILGLLTLLLSIGTKLTGQIYDNFPLKPGLQYLYQYDSRYDYNNLGLSYSTRDSGVVKYYISDSAITNDTSISWSILQVSNFRHWYGQGGPGFDTSWNVSDSLQFILSESTLRQHELQANSLLWRFPLVNHALDTLHLNRYCDSTPVLLHKNYNCLSALGSFDSLWFSTDSGFYYLRWNRCEDFDDFFGTNDNGSARLLERTTVSVDRADIQPVEYDLISVYPNPFNPMTTVRYTLKYFLEFDLTIYDLLGREVKKLAHDMKPPGTYSIGFDGSSIASGVYIVILRTRTSFVTSKMIMVK